MRSFFNLLKRAGSYFDEIYDAIEKVFHKKGQYIELSAELVDIENKINRLKQENERNEKLVYEAEQRKKDLMMYLAHDLKTPLSSIIGYLTLLTEER